MKKVVIIALIGMVTVSCSMSRRTVTNRTINASSQNIIVKPLVAEVQVDITRKISGTGVVTNGNVNDAKELAKWNAINSSGADIIVDPIYDVSIKGMTVEAKVVGFFGKYVKIETVKDEDLDKIELYKINNKKNEASVVNKLEKFKQTRK